MIHHSGLVAFSVLGLLASPSQAERCQFANMIYEIPAGWEQGAVVGGLSYLNADLPSGKCRFCTITLSTGVASNGSPDAVLRANYLRFVDPEYQNLVKVVRPVEPMHDGGRDIALMGLSVGGKAQLILAVALKGRVEMAAFTGPASNEAELQESMAVYGSDFVPFLFSMTYLSEGATPVMPKAAPGSMSGLWWGAASYWTNDINGAMVQRERNEVLVFWSDGHVYDGTPPDGLRPPDAAELLAAGDPGIGVYRERGDRIEIVLGIGGPRVLARNGAGWSLGNVTLTRMEPLHDGARINGRLDNIRVVDFPDMGNGGGGATTYSSEVFRPDGTWNTDRTGVAAGQFSGGGFGAAGSTGESGTYVVRDGVLVRTDSSGGAARRDLVFRLGDQIMVGTQLLTLPTP